jgi:hypothetical protein
MSERRPDPVYVNGVFAPEQSARKGHDFVMARQERPTHLRQKNRHIGVTGNLSILR